jgi:acyl-CoA reductase-like NAD-dependent aldehyde dehydrogenase
VAREVRKFAEIVVLDNGKLLAEMYGQLIQNSHWCFCFSGFLDKIKDRFIQHDKEGFFNSSRNEPIRVVSIITRWNSPRLLTAWNLASALAAGYSVVIKPLEFASA